MPDYSNETFVVQNEDGSVSLDPYAGKSREELKQRCRELVMAVTDWQMTAIFAATDGGNSIDNVRAPYRSKIEALMEGYADDEGGADV